MRNNVIINLWDINIKKNSCLFWSLCTISVRIVEILIKQKFILSTANARITDVCNKRCNQTSPISYMYQFYPSKLLFYKKIWRKKKFIRFSFTRVRTISKESLVYWFVPLSFFFFFLISIFLYYKNRTINVKALKNFRI